MIKADAQDQVTEQASLEEVSGICRNRAANYAYLSQLYKVEVSKELFDQLVTMRVPADMGNAKSDSGYKLLASYLSAASENAVTELAVDYAHVFLGHGVDGYSAAYPYESVYTSEKRLLMQAARDEVLAIYRSQHLDKDDDWKESEDHLAVELEFMQVMAAKTADALSEGDEDEAYALLEVQREFMQDHLAIWVPALAIDMGRFARTDFYRGLALITEGFLETDMQFMSELLGTEEASNGRTTKR